MADDWRPIDATARSASRVSLRFPPIDGNPNIRECEGHYTGNGVWAVVENDRIVGTALDAIEWKPLA